MDLVKNEVSQWFDAQSFLIGSANMPEIDVESMQLKKWELLPDPWLKCNVSISWSIRNKFAEGSWILKGFRGVVLLHSRCFSFIDFWMMLKLISCYGLLRV